MGYGITGTNEYLTISADDFPKSIKATWISEEEFSGTMLGEKEGGESMNRVIGNWIEMERFEEDMKMIIKYDARGFSEEDIEVTKEFHNKTKQLYLNIKGKVEIEEIQYKNEIDIKLPVDKDVYRGASWKLINGILVIILYEKKNPEPDFNVLYEE